MANQVGQDLISCCWLDLALHLNLAHYEEMFNVDHSTVIHSVKAHEDKIVSDRIYKDMYSRIVQFTKEILDQNVIKIDSDISLESAVKVRVAKKAINKQRKNKQQEVR